jgi:hypothetical protein
MPVINGVYLKDFTALPDAVADANIIPIAISGNQVAYRTTVGGIVTDARVTGKLLTGLSVTGGDIASTDSILTAFGKVQNQINNLSSGYVTLATTQTITGTKTFDNPIYLKQRSSFIEPPNEYSLISSTDLGFWFANKRAGGAFQSFNLDVTTITNGSVRTYIMPNANGTIALTSDIPSLTGYVTLDTDQTITGAKTLTSLLIGTRANFTSSGSGDTLGINHSSGSGIALYITKAGNGEGIYINKSSGSGNAVTVVGTLNATTLVKNGGTSSQFLKADGSIDSNTYALASALSAYVPYTGATSLVNLGIYNLKANSLYAEGDGSSTGGGLLIKQYVSGTTSITGYNTISSQTSGFFFSASQGGSYKNFLFDATSLTDLTVRSYTLPNASGTLALTSDLGAYLPLSGGTLTGALFGTTASFASSIGLTSASSSSILTSTTNGIEISVDGSTTSNKNTIFKVGSSETMRIDASGNLGLGVTPSAWSNSGNLDLQDVYLSLSSQGTYGGAISNNAYYNSGWKYKAANYSTQYQTLAGEHRWLTAGVGGAAGNAISFTQAMTLDASGNLGLGTTSPQSTDNFTHLDVVGKITTQGGAIWVSNSNKTTRGILYNTDQIVYVGSVTNTPFVLNTNDTERVRITSAGNVGIGTTSPQGIFEAVGLSYLTRSGQSLLINPNYGGANTHIQFQAVGNMGIAFATNGDNEAMRITSGGDVLINKNSLSAGTVGVEFERNSTTRMTTDGNTALLLNRLSSDGTILDFRRSTTQVGSISVTTSATSYNTSSDYRLKQDLKEYNGIDLISKIKTYNYEWKSDKSRSYGVLAHELQEVLPYAVVGKKDDEQMQGVDYSKLVPVLVKAIQEQQAQIEELKALINK